MYNCLKHSKQSNCRKVEKRRRSRKGSIAICIASTPLNWSLFKLVEVDKLMVEVAESMMATRLKLLMVLDVPSLAESLCKPAIPFLLKLNQNFQLISSVSSSLRTQAPFLVQQTFQCPDVGEIQRIRLHTHSQLAIYNTQPSATSKQIIQVQQGVPQNDLIFPVSGYMVRFKIIDPKTVFPRPLEKNGLCSRENEVKISIKTQNGQK